MLFRGNAGARHRTFGCLPFGQVRAPMTASDGCWWGDRRCIIWVRHVYRGTQGVRWQYATWQWWEILEEQTVWFSPIRMKHSTKTLQLTCDRKTWVAPQYLSRRLHHHLSILHLLVCHLGSIAVYSVAKPHPPWRVYNHIWLSRNIAGKPCNGLPKNISLLSL